ncbi:MAG: heavy metal translocating P-type ATPase, partial [Acidimicrobiales bacterium]
MSSAPTHSDTDTDHGIDPGASHRSADPHHAADAHADHGGHGGHDKHAGHDPDMFRRRFWLSLVLTIPLVVTSEM